MDFIFTFGFLRMFFRFTTFSSRYVMDKIKRCTLGWASIWVSALVAVSALNVPASAEVLFQPSLVRKSAPPITLVRTGPADYFADFGQDWFAQLHLRVNSPRAGKIITVMMGEKALARDRVNPHPGGYITFYKTHIRLRQGRHAYNVPLPRADARRMPHAIGAVMPFRYVQIIGCPSVLRARDVQQIRVHYPFDRTAARFHCDNDNLNAVWGLCHHTIEAVTFCGMFVDGNRERRPYEADALIAELDWFNSTTDTTLPARTNQYLIYHPTWPTEWIMQSVLAAWYDYLYTGNKTLIRKNYTALKAKTLAALERPDGLISTITPPVSVSVLHSIYRSRPIRAVVDWPQNERDGYVMRPINTVVNAFHYRSMALMSRIAAALGHTHDARYFASRAKLIRSTMNRLLINRTTGLYIDGIGTKHSAIQANFFPLAFGIAPKADQSHIADFLVKQGMRCSVYGAQYLLTALYRAGRGQAALNLLSSSGRHTWMEMLAEGSTLTTEAWSLRIKPNEDWNHIWGAAPGNIIPRYLMGIRPLDPGFAKAIIAPQPGNLGFVRITVPTVHGEIAEKIIQSPSSATISLTVPPGIHAVLRLPPKWRHARKITMDGRTLSAAAQYNALSDLGPGYHIAVMSN